MKISTTQLKELVKTVVSEETEYQTFFKKALEKTGKSIPSMSDEEKKEFFNKIDAAWKSKGEKNEGNAFGAAVTKAKEQGEDHFEVGGKTYKVESVNDGSMRESKPPKGVNLSIVDKEIKRRGKANMLKHFKDIKKNKLYTKVNTPKSIDYLINYVSNFNESVNEGRAVSKPIRVDDDTMVQIVGDDKGFRELTAALNPKTGKPIQKFGFDRGNETANSKEELIKKLQKKYGNGFKFESVNEGKLKKFDDVHIKSKNLSGMVYKIQGNTIIVRTIDGLVKAKKDDVTKIHSDNVNEDLGTIALGVISGIGLYKILKFALKKVGVAVGSRVSLPKESLHKIVEQTHQALIKNFIKGDKTLNMMEIASLSKLLKDYIDEGKIKNAKDIQTYSKRAIEAIIKTRK